MVRLAVAFALIPAALVACGGDTRTGTDTPPIVKEESDAGEPEPDPEPTPDAAPVTPTSCSVTGEMILGTGVESFVPVTDGDTVYIYLGPQTAYMLYIAVRARGIDPADVTLSYQVHFAGGEKIGEGSWRIMLTNDAGDGWRERLGVWGALDKRFTSSPQLVKDHDITLDVKLADTKGGCATAHYAAHVSPERGM
jgi:hypothetical protein